MDHSIPYSRGYASDSDDDGPNEEVDEEGFTTKEAEASTKVLGRDHRTPLFEDLSLADEAVVDGGEGILFGVRPPSYRDKHGKNIILPGSKFETFLELKMWLDEYYVTHYRPHKVVHSNMKLHYIVACIAASQPNKATTEWGHKDAVGEDQGLWERAAKKLREEDSAKAERKKEEEREPKMKQETKIMLDHYYYEQRIKEEHKKFTEKR
ncbi:hypothetical protein D1007_26383 [Hordeum vulgare]|nr:hypothetical protein D1007_26383 [Hordeum vulgare]